jgi:hypothetical protein
METLLKGHGGPGHGVLQTLDGAVMARAGRGLAGLLAVVLDQILQLAAAGVQGASEIQGDIGGMVIMGLTELDGPIIEQLPLVGTLLGNLDRISVHV